ncbi:MAG TPA: alpha/beta hydrolase [Chryseolinea sp.]|jgi:pimeloyl-ACP methyl ester carboxylesterase|nr:alpha/beta hydrolase [Chryseolinea sp.]HZB15193.1 alpha/beta hydrolase [Chryseolinea sp.]
MTTLFSQEKGAGKPVVLLHGFPFHQSIWDGYRERLSDEFRVVTVDLPGFGKSPPLNSPFTLEQVASTLNSFLVNKNLSRVNLIGHSLGGYVALAMVKNDPDLFASLTLFHSTAYADSAEKKESRSKVVEFVQKNGALPFTSGFIPPLFFNPTHLAVERVKKIASEASSESVIGYTLAMRDRPDHIKTLEVFKNPTLFLAGKNDPGIPPDSIRKQATHCQKGEIHIFDNVSHMGMLEKPEETVSKIKDFLSKSNV